MPSAKNPYKPKTRSSQNKTAMFPTLHEDVKNNLSEYSINPEPWFNSNENDRTMLEDYSTFVMGRFECHNQNCAQRGWGSKKIAITIQRFPNNGYNAVVFKQRCKSPGCNRLGRLRLDKNSYVERVTYRLKKWAGIPMETPEYDGFEGGPPHLSKLCEGCKAGRCQMSVGAMASRFRSSTYGHRFLVAQYNE
ncbi:zinc-binding domain-containing protein [Corynascus novoguineensis]|uniref:Zinc-binding domain-containing protein n=1 Tax=Corynascus novoguineensis TaxID=1126955 RepID=A0AAN7CP12_9PEZI|nr:zinc-binding domain-containing protein [Corynascus novoguineensis]